MNKNIVYDYDPDDFFYTGPIQAQLDPVGGDVMIPGHATDVSPPKFDPEKNEIPVFSPKEKKWTIVEDNFWRPKFIEKQYNLDKVYSEFPILPILPIHKFKSYPRIPRLLNPQLFHLNLISRINSINLRINSIITQFNSIKTPGKGTILELFFLYRSEIEMVIHLIKKSLDDIITINYVMLDLNEIVEKHIIKINSIGKLFKYENDEKCISLRDIINYEKHSPFLHQINDIHNSVKHDIFLSEVSNIVGDHWPVIAILKPKGNNFDTMEYQIHDLATIINDFSVFLKEVLLV